MSPDQPEGAAPEPQPPSYESPAPEPQQPAPRSRWRRIVPWAFGCGCLIWIILPLIFVVGLLSALLPGEPAGPKVALIRVSGVIHAGSEGGILGGGTAGAETLVERVERARRDPSVKAVVLRINSPGGTVAGSEEIYKEIKRVRASKPVYASMGDVAASGGYYISCACTRVFADSSTATGSIGVIFESPNLAGLFKKLGVDLQVVKTGKFKDIGSPSRPLTPEERRLIQDMINDSFEQFIGVVSEGRSMPKARVRQLATGRVFTGRQAKRLGLVDEIGDLRDTTLAAARAGGIRGEPTVVKYGPRGLFAGAFGDSSTADENPIRDRGSVTDAVLRRLAR